MIQASITRLLNFVEMYFKYRQKNYICHCPFQGSAPYVPLICFFCRSYMLNASCFVLLFCSFVSCQRNFYFYLALAPTSLHSFSPLSLNVRPIYCTFTVLLYNSLSYFTALSLPIFKYISFPPERCTGTFPFFFFLGDSKDIYYSFYFFQCVCPLFVWYGYLGPLL